MSEKQLILMFFNFINLMSVDRTRGFLVSEKIGIFIQREILRRGNSQRYLMPFKNRNKTINTQLGLLRVPKI